MPFSSLNSFMGKRKPRRSEIAVVDELALTKSAAWAWYERGSGSNSSSIPEIDAWRTKMEPRPSRYKLEASRNVQVDQASNSRITFASNSLLDSYEIERIYKQLDHYVESSQAMYHGGDHSGGVAAAAAERKNKAGKRKKAPKGFWFRHVPVCGSSRNGVVEIQSSEYGRRRRPEKGRVAVVEVASCRPRPWRIRA